MYYECSLSTMSRNLHVQTQPHDSFMTTEKKMVIDKISVMHNFHRIIIKCVCDVRTWYKHKYKLAAPPYVSLMYSEMQICFKNVSFGALVFGKLCYGWVWCGYKAQGTKNLWDGTTLQLLQPASHCIVLFP